MKTKRLREAREAGLVLPQSGYEMSNEEMMYVDGGNILDRVGRIAAGILAVIGAIGAWISGVGWFRRIGRAIVGGIKTTSLFAGKASFLKNPLIGATVVIGVLSTIAWTGIVGSAAAFAAREVLGLF